MRARYRVDVIESERGWGRSILESKLFKSLVEAKEFVNQTNAHNIARSALDYYIRAEEPVLVDLDAPKGS